MFFAHAVLSPAYAQDLGFGITWTWLLVAALVLIAMFLIALRFKWIEFYVETGRPAIPPSHEYLEETIDVDASDRVVTEYKSGLQSALQTLKEQKETLTAERDRLREARENTAAEARSYMTLVAELQKSRDQTKQYSFEIIELRQRLATRTKEIDQLQAQLAKEREGLEKLRGKLQAERSELDELRNELKRVKADVDRTMQEVAREWELLDIRREELENARKDVLEAVGAFRSTREALLQELEASAQVWSGGSS